MRKTLAFSLCALIISVLAACGAWAGEIKGVIKPQGLRSAEGILVYLANGPESKLDLAGANFVMDQRDLTFIPHILAVPLGATVDFPNHDKVDHNVFSLSQAKKFNLGSYKPGSGIKVTFDHPGVVELRCDIHQDMKAYILVMKSPYFAITGPDGSFTIPDQALLKSYGLAPAPELPAGKYLVKTWHDKLSTALAPVEVPASGAASVELTPKRGAPGVLYK